jgi:dATP pyrophosphohydrolase
MKRDVPEEKGYFSIHIITSVLFQVSFMSRAPFQVLVLPFHCLQSGSLEYAIFKYWDRRYWQFIVVGGENLEKPVESAKREAFEEASISPESEYIILDSCNTIPVEGMTGEFT